MDTEQVTDGQALPASVVQEAQESEKTDHDSEPLNDRKDYQGKVDFDSLPDEVRHTVEARISTLTKKLGNQERRFLSQIRERDDLLKQQSAMLDELQTGMGAVVDHLQDKSLVDAETRIMERLERAHESGDTKAFLAANRELAQLEAKKILAEDRKNTKPKQEKRQTESFSSDDVLNDAVEDGVVAPETARAVNAWMNEKDDTGRLLRPWAHSKNPKNPTADPVYKRALLEMTAIYDSEDDSNPWNHRTDAEKLAEMDRRMGLVRNGNSQSVLGGNLTMSRKTTRLALTPQQEQIALKTKFGGSKAKSDADHLEAYRKQLEKVRADKGSRK